MPPPRVSVCVPTYNGASHLKECIRSIQAQTFSDFEVLVCDDQSSDGTLDLARSLAGDDLRFRFVPNPRRFGLVGNWNNCIKQARGEWIKFVFQDDLLKPQCLEKMHRTAISNNALFVCCRRDFIFEGEPTPETCRFYLNHAVQLEEFYAQGSYVSPTVFAKAVAEFSGTNFVGEPTVTLIHRTLFDNYGVFNPSLIMSCDLECWCRFGTHVGVTLVPDILASFRVHNNSTSADNFARRKFRLSILDPLIILYEFVANPIYSALREISRAEYGSEYLSEKCKKHIKLAGEWLKEDYINGRKTFDRSEFEAVSKIYPGLKWLMRRERCISWLRSFRGGDRCLRLFKWIIKSFKDRWPVAFSV